MFSLLTLFPLPSLHQPCQFKTQADGATRLGQPCFPQRTTTLSL